MSDDLSIEEVNITRVKYIDKNLFIFKRFKLK
jgi:hypothetical protein